MLEPASRRPSATGLDLAVDWRYIGFSILFSVAARDLGLNGCDFAKMVDLKVYGLLMPRFLLGSRSVGG
ncbi:hypothetical protein J5N97_009010 [Dioscorea zingiberensis]|uniref:Uncharacterized protein n=1 Tax=Dioscorea zingiberensis TaxID=325984 RepID=A0A9D5CYN7_9LILI|nr:hypothetical protein J5N97_009010 [Dioscorea zingiberensis]